MTIANYYSRGGHEMKEKGFKKIRMKNTMLGGSLVTMAWHILRLRMEGRPLYTDGSCKYIE
jgi:hypothetical protein